MTPTTTMTRGRSAVDPNRDMARYLASLGPGWRDAAAKFLAEVQGSLIQAVQTNHSQDRTKATANRVADAIKATDNLLVEHDNEAAIRDQAAAAQTLVIIVDTEAEVTRTSRNLAMLVLLRPYSDVDNEFEHAKARLVERLDKGKITQAKYEAELADLQIAANTQMRDIRWKPTPVANLAGVTRGLLAESIRPVEPETLPEMTEEQAKEETILRSEQTRHWAMLRGIAEHARNVAMHRLMGAPRNGGFGVSNADVSRLLSVTNPITGEEKRFSTARTAQIRTGTTHPPKAATSPRGGGRRK
jgi:hypothetical protein